MEGSFLQNKQMSTVREQTLIQQHLFHLHIRPIPPGFYNLLICHPKNFQCLETDLFSRSRNPTQFGTVGTREPNVKNRFEVH